jgi:hypothetical protein
MHIKAQFEVSEKPFEPARADFEDLVELLESSATGNMTHSQVECLISARGTELMRQLFQGYLNSGGLGEAEGDVITEDGNVQTHVRVRKRRLMSKFGPVEVTRTGYRSREQSPVYPRDGELNLPEDSYSFGTRKRIAVEAAKNSFDEAVDSIKETTGANVPKRQAEELVRRSAVDFDAFYRERERIALAQEETGPIVVISADGKGVVMRKEDLREATKSALEEETHKLDSKLSKGEKHQRKRMATVAAVYTIEPYIRTAEDIVSELRRVHKEKPERPSPENKRVWASLEKSPEEVIEEAFAEAYRRDPERKKHWVALVDGNKNQINILHRCAKKYKVKLTIVLDLMHVLGYLWNASYAFHEEASKEAEAWVKERLFAILKGQAGYVAGGIRRSATLRKLRGEKRKAAETCADYLLKHSVYLRYDACLANGFPIATGVIEGACRNLIKDRMDVTGARWSLRGAEAVLRLRSLRSSGDFEQYWTFHERQELHRNHISKYAAGIPPTQKPLAQGVRRSRGNLRLVK